MSQVVKSMNKNGRYYRYQAMKLISICRMLSSISTEFHDQDKLQSVLEECDLAITRAVESGDDIDPTTNNLFEKATRKLRDYHKDREFKSDAKSLIDDPMEHAKNRDKRNKRQFRKEKDLDPVKFRILHSLPPERNSTIVEQYISPSSDLPEILWYFGHYKPKDKRRLALAQNPNFYNTLPTSSAGYKGIGPIEFPNDLSCPAFDVLTNDCGRVFLERNPQPRIFDNLWDINGILIFKDAYGNLEDGQTFPNVVAVWVCSQYPEPQLEGPESDWKVQIRKLWKVNSYSCIHIRAKDL